MLGIIFFSMTCVYLQQKEGRAEEVSGEEISLSEENRQKNRMIHSYYSYCHVIRHHGYICSYHVRAGIHGQVVGVVVEEAEQPLLDGGFDGGGAEVCCQPCTMLHK